MESMKVIFFVLTSFFGIEDGRIAAEKTTITLYPEQKEIQIAQEGLFTFIQSAKDSTIVLEQWDKIRKMDKGQTDWSTGLDKFPEKKFSITPEMDKNTTQPWFSLNYETEKDLSVFGIKYNVEENTFTIENPPQYNIKSTDGQIEDNHWVFDAENPFTFTYEPFLQIPESELHLKM